MRTALSFFLVLALAGCDSVFGGKDDPTTDEIFDEGQIDPTLVDEVGYVPLNPFYTEGVGGTFDQPVGVYVGYDELIYVGDREGVHVLDLAGRPQRFLGEIGWPGGEEQPIRDITALTQDRRFNLYVAARRDTTLGDVTWDLPVVYRISGLTTGAPRLEDIIWHPFDDQSRTANNFRNPRVFGAEGFSDEDARFTGVAALADNRVYVTRSGPLNTLAQGLPGIVNPFNGVLEFSPEGRNNRYINALSPTQPSLLSAVYPSAIATSVGPPQRTGLSDSPDFFVAQDPPDTLGLSVPYPVLSVRVVETPDGTVYSVDIDLLGAAANPDNGDGFLYEVFGTQSPTGIAVAADATGYLFVSDAETDSLYIFNRNGVEGVAPPAASGSLRPVRVSFGGEGSGLLQFRDPQSVAYFDRTVYVADMGNNRIARYRLNTDFE